MNREEGMELVQRSIDGDLNEEESARLQTYLQNYPECAALLEKLTRLSEELTQLPHVAPRYSLVDAILPQLERITPEPAPGASEAAAVEAPYEPRSRRPASRKTLYRRVAGVVAAGVVAGVLLIAHPFSLLPESDQQKSASQSDALPESATAGDTQADMLRVQTKMAAPSGGDQAQNEANASASASQDGVTPSPATVTGTSTDGGAPSAGTGSTGSGTSAATPSGSAAGKPTSDVQEKLPVAGLNPTTSAETPGIQGFGPSATASADNRDKDAREGGGPAATDAPAQTGEPNMSLAMTLDQWWQSPDGKLTAIADAGGIRIVKTGQDQAVFESESRKGTISDVSWGQESQDLYYTWTDASGKKTDLWWNAKDNREQTR